MRILICPDSFKGTLSAEKASVIIASAARGVFRGAKIVRQPLADGGEGTIEVLKRQKGFRAFEKTVLGPMGKKTKAKYLYNSKKRIAFIEMAQASGLLLVGKKKNLMKATTFGTGQLISAALDKGAKEIFIGIGGSATNDCGIGMAQALGARFFEKNGKKIRGLGCGTHIGKIKKIGLGKIGKRIGRTKITILSDVNNPLFGKNGAAYIYGPQKGASPKMTRELDLNMRKFDKIVSKSIGKKFSMIPGAGAAGGLGFGLMAFTGAKIEPGILMVMGIVGFEKMAEKTDLVVTGEGRLDEQSCKGKTLWGICKVCRKKRVKAIAVVGSLGKGFKCIHSHGIAIIASCTGKKKLGEKRLKKDAEENLRRASFGALSRVKERWFI